MPKEDPTSTQKAIPERSLRRLPLYYRLLKELPDDAGPAISSNEIGRQLNLDPTQVRKDLEMVGVSGRPKIGFPVAETIEGISTFLGWQKVNEAFLVGAGSLGSALLGYRKFEECGLKIVAAFDDDPGKVGSRIHGIVVLKTEMLADLAQRMGILIGIITVPAPEAQDVAELMVEGGIRAIWNFAPVQLTLPEQIIVHNEDLYCSLAALSQKLSLELKARPAKATGPRDRARLRKLLS